MATTGPPPTVVDVGERQAAAASHGQALPVMEAAAEGAGEQVVPQPVYVPPPRPVYTAPVSRAAAPAKKEKSGPSVPIVAGAAVAAVTLIAAGITIIKSGGKKSGQSVQKSASRPASASRTASKVSSSSSRSATARPSSTGGASRTGTARTSTSGRRSSGSGSSSSRPATRSTAAAAASGAAAGAAAAPRRSSIGSRRASAGTPSPTPAAPAAAATAPQAPAVQEVPAAAAVPAKEAAAAAAAAAPQPALAAVAQVPEAPAAPSEKEEPSAPTTPAVNAEAAPAEAAVASPTPDEAAAAADLPASLKEVPATPTAEKPKASAEPTAAAAAAAATATAKPAAAAAAAAEPAEAEADVPSNAAVAQEAAADVADTADSAGAAPAAAEAVAEAAGADTAAADAAANGTAAADAAAADGEAAAEGEEGDLIELQEGETLPVVDENGNQLGTLHHDGRVLDAEGKEIGGLDEDGSVVLYEQQAVEEAMVLSPAEEEAEQLMRQAAMAWNVQNNREAAEKLQRRALQVVTAQAGAARPEIVAEVASSLADMLYATNKLTDAKEALQVALDAAEEGGQHALYIKLSNNMGAVLRKQELHAEGKELHQKAMQVALDNFGVAHATTTLARGNLVDALDLLGEREEARKLLNDSVEAITEFAEKKSAEEASGKQANGSSDGAAAAAAAAAAANGTDADKDVSPEMASMLAVDSTRALTACIRARIELARLEMKDKCFDRAVEVLEQALDTAKDKFGAETAEASSVMAALATCHRQAGNLDTSAQLFEQLYGINERQSEGNNAANQSGVMLARTLADVLSEAGRDSDALVWAEKALELVQQVAELPRGHPALEPHINLVIELKHKTGDEAGAEELRKELLKAKAKLMAAMQRAGNAGGRGAGGRPATGAASAPASRANGASGKASSSGKASGAAGKKGGRRK